ncbi:MAG: nucleoside-diphosphate-sugar pyrophosphorylase [Bdellovibrio sp.]|nr:nucleoside-diphosphate-sugar pyrophosphorylase [Bdellovibrio sp.]
MIKVFIPCAGTGSRLGHKTTFLNKALVSVGLKPAISYLIDKIPKHFPIVIALGYKGDTLKDFLQLAYPDNIFEFVWVSKFEGQGSGIGLSTLVAENNLQCPFVFWTCDTLFLEPLPQLDENWVACHSLPKGRDLNEFRCVAAKPINDLGVERVMGIFNKGQHQQDQQPYVGLLFIKDYQSFFTGLKDGGAAAIDQGEAYGVAEMLKRGDQFIKKEMKTWFDTGSLIGLKEANEIFPVDEPAVILEKYNEAIWFLNEMVIKFSDDASFIKKRVERAEILKGFVPELISSKKNLYAYRKVKGEVLSRNPSVTEFKNLLTWLQSFWKKFTLTESQMVKFQKACDHFYRLKTLARVQKFHDLYPSFPREGHLNGIKVLPVDQLLSKVPWAQLADGIAMRIHGDLHFENILRVADSRQFVLLDWRQDFAGLDQYGDLYYDLAKLNHGFVVDHHLIEKGQYKVDVVENGVQFDFAIIPELQKCQESLKNFVANQGYSQHKVNLLTALIFLNSAPLHHESYAKLIYSLGRKMLADALVEMT